jgi:MarR family 2-MHQ and catechol resistance regulon transcriptional repressor
MKTTEQYGPKVDRALSMWVKLARAFSTFHKLTADHIRKFNLTQPQFGALETLGHLGPMTIGELCKKQLVSGGNMTVVVDNLVERRLVDRVTSREDHRSYIVKLTPKGKKLFDRIFKEHAEFVTRISGVLSEEEQEELGRLLKKLGTNCAAATRAATY